MVFRDHLKERFKNEKIIEFGPLNRPLFNKGESQNIKYADIRSTEEIKALYTGNDYLNKTGITLDLDTIVEVDYKVDGSYKSTFKDEKFSVAYLSHVIEHMPNIINFFIEIKEILTDNGRLAIIYPDKRYCFDHFRNSVSFRDAYATYKNGTRENARIAFDFGYNVVHENSAEFFWQGTKLTNVISKNNLQDAEKYYRETLTGAIDDGDVHFWPFSDIDFLKFIYEMKRADLFDYDIEEFYPTQENTQEFMIILKKSKNKDYSNVLKLINEYDTQAKESRYKEEIQKLETDIEKIKEEYTKQLQQQINEKNEQIAEKSNQINSLQRQVQQLNGNIEELNMAIQNYEKSKSWKITKPIRIISNKIKKLRDRDGK